MKIVIVTEKFEIPIEGMRLIKVYMPGKHKMKDDVALECIAQEKGYESTEE